MSPRLARTATLAALVLALASADARAATTSAYLYATSWDAQGVRQYAADGSLLAPLTPPNAPAGATSTAAAPSADGHSLYVVNQGSSTVSQYDVADDGTLSPKTPETVATGSSPFGIAVAPDGAHVYVANQGAGTVSVFAVGTGGALTLASTATAGVGAMQIALNPDGAHAYVTNFNAGTVSQYTVNADGSLTADGAAVAAGAAPAGIALSPDGDSAYVANRSRPGTISQFDVAADGTLTPKATPQVAAGMQTVAVAATTSGVYASNFGDNTISEYDAGAAGALTPKATPAIDGGRSPWGLTPSPDGSSLYVAAYSDAAVRQFDVGAGGQLAPKATPAVGAGLNPISVAAVPAAPPAPTDTEKPTIDLRTPASGAQYGVGDSVIVDYSCADEGGSGLASCTGTLPTGSTLDTSTPGTYTFTVTASDGAGNSASVTHTYTVAASGYTFGGFLGPIQNGTRVKAGATIPIVFSLGGDLGLGILAPGSPTTGKVNCGSSVPVSTEPALSDGGLRFNPFTGHYAFKWKTKRSWAGTCRAFVLTLADGSVHTLVVRFRGPCSSGR